MSKPLTVLYLFANNKDLRQGAQRVLEDIPEATVRYAAWDIPLSAKDDVTEDTYLFKVYDRDTFRGARCDVVFCDSRLGTQLTDDDWDIILSSVAKGTEQ